MGRLDSKEAKNRSHAHIANDGTNITLYIDGNMSVMEESLEAHSYLIQEKNYYDREREKKEPKIIK